MQIIDMAATPTSAVALYTSAKPEDGLKTAFVVTQGLDYHLLEEFCGDYDVLYVSAEVDPVVDAMMELGRYQKADTADIFVLPPVDAETERVFIRGYITPRYSREHLQKALAA